MPSFDARTPRGLHAGSMSRRRSSVSGIAMFSDDDAEYARAPLMSRSGPAVHVVAETQRPAPPLGVVATYCRIVLSSVLGLVVGAERRTSHSVGDFSLLVVSCRVFPRLDVSGCPVVHVTCFVWCMKAAHTPCGVLFMFACVPRAVRGASRHPTRP